MHKRKAGKLQTGSTFPKQYWLAVNGKPKTKLRPSYANEHEQNHYKWDDGIFTSVYYKVVNKHTKYITLWVKTMIVMQTCYKAQTTLINVKTQRCMCEYNIDRHQQMPTKVKQYLRIYIITNTIILWSPWFWRTNFKTNPSKTSIW